MINKQDTERKKNRFYNTHVWTESLWIISVTKRDAFLFWMCVQKSLINARYERHEWGGQKTGHGRRLKL